VSVDAARLRPFLRPLSGGSEDLDEIVSSARNARYVLIGEATHGTHEFYSMRAEITKRLLAEEGFAAVAIEGDWPDAYRVHRYVNGRGDGDAEEALAGFRRFPTWMWRNADVLDFVGWLRSFNDAMRPVQRAGFFGLDLYSLYSSMEAVVAYLDGVNPEAARRARERYACFDAFGDDADTYAREAGLGLSSACRNEAVAQLVEMQRRALALLEFDGEAEAEREFFAEQNAFVVVGAEEYYRRMLDAGVSSWNLRDGFMYRTLERLREHLGRRRRTPAKIVVWAHNSHVGDARATSMGTQGEFTIGQLAREANASAARLIGFTTSAGSVTAASGWGSATDRKTLRSPVEESWEALFSSTGLPRFVLDLEKACAAYGDLDTTLLERAVGVVYLPESELRSHYMRARLCRQFDTLFHYEYTRAVEPLERGVGGQRREAPETFPSGV